MNHSSSAKETVNGTHAGNGEGRLNITAASEYLETSRNTTWRVIKRNRIKTFENPLDMRETLVLREDLDRIKSQLRPKSKKSRRKSSGRAAQL